MPKAIYSNFEGGLSTSDRNAPENTYFEGREVDPQRGDSTNEAGYLMPGFLTSTVTKSDDNPQIINDLIIDIVADRSAAADAYLLDVSDRIYHITDTINDTFDTDFDGGGNYYKAITGATRGEKLFIYPTKIGGAAAADKLFYFYQDDFGMYDLSSTFDDDWGSDVPTGKGALNDAPHPVIEWNSYMWIGNGRYLAKFDGQTGDNGTIEREKLDLGQGWEITTTFPTRNFIGICAWKKQYGGNETYRAESKIFFYDGTSDTFAYSIPIADNKVLASFNDNGTILIWTRGRDLAISLSYLTENGLQRIKRLKIPISGTSTFFDNMYPNAIDIFYNKPIFGTRYIICAYGSNEVEKPKAFTIPYGCAGDGASLIGAIRTVAWNRTYISWHDVTNSKYYLLKAATGYSTRATYRGNYKDFGQKIRINYIKFYFKPLVTSDSVTVSIDTDYGTANTLGTITQASDGTGATSKRFNKIITCHSFRPVISWTAGGVAFSKIVVDYDFISDLD